MQKRRKIFPVFAGFFLISLLVYLFSYGGYTNGISSFISQALVPVQKSIISLFHREDKSEIELLREENMELRAQLAKIAILEQDNKALRDQFALTTPSPIKLLPAHIVSSPGLPKIANANAITIDKGSENGVKVGMYVVYKDNLIGKIGRVSPNLSVVQLISHPNMSFASSTLKTGAEGVLRGSGDNKLVLQNVLLTDTLEENDTVVMKEKAFLVVGKLVSVNKKPNALFQSADVTSLVDISKTRSVFVLLEN